MNPLRHFLRREPLTSARADPLSHVDRDLAFKGAEVIGRLPENERVAVLEMLSVADGPLWRLCWPGFNHLIHRAADESERTRGEPS